MIDEVSEATKQESKLKEINIVSKNNWITEDDPRTIDLSLTKIAKNHVNIEKKLF